MWQLIINGPGYFDTAYELPEGFTHLGRADENDIVLSGELVSRRHMRLTAAGDELTVEDLGSRNGSRINGEPLHGIATVRSGDTITIGENTLSVRRASASDTATTDPVDVGSGGVKRYGRGSEIGGAVLVSRAVRESVVLRALDNVSPFDTEPGVPTPFGDAQKQVSYEWLLTLYKTAEKLTSARTLEEFLDEATDRVMERAKATTAVVLLRHASGSLVPAAVRHRGRLAKGEVPLSDAIIDAAFEKGAALAVNVREDRRFNRRDSVILYGVDQVLCVPIRQRDEYVGALYLNRTGGDTQELEQLLDLCTAVASLISTGVERFQTKSSLKEERLRQALERFHAPDIVERRLAELAKSGGGPLTQMEERLCTILFADIAGFTALMKQLPCARVMEILNEFYDRMTGIVFSFEGTVDKFIGDSVMAVFGAPYAKGDEAQRAVRTAIAMRDEWDRTVHRFPPEQRLRLRIGLNTGNVLAGTVGSEARLDYTVVGEPVNVASWLAASAAPGQVLITGKSLAVIGARFNVTPLGERVIHAPGDKVWAFEVLNEE